MKIKHYFGLIIVIILSLFIITFYLVISSYSLKYLDIVQKYSDIYGLDDYLVMSIIRAESDFNPDVVSNKGAIGLMQIMPDTAKFIASSLGEEFKRENLFDPITNIRYGCYYLSYLKLKFVDTYEVIASYNMGETKLFGLKAESDYDINNLKIKETKNYLDKVKKNMKMYKVLIPN